MTESMTIDEYERRITALGFTSGANWAEYVGIDRTTHHRHLQKDSPPRYLELIVEFLEEQVSKNPNPSAHIAPFKDAAGALIRGGDTLVTASGLHCTVTRVDPIEEPEARLWYAAYDDGVLVPLEPLVTGKTKAVVTPSKEA